MTPEDFMKGLGVDDSAMQVVLAMIKDPLIVNTKEFLAYSEEIQKYVLDIYSQYILLTRDISFKEDDYDSVSVAKSQLGDYSIGKDSDVSSPAEGSKAESTPKTPNDDEIRSRARSLINADVATDVIDPPPAPVDSSENLAETPSKAAALPAVVVLEDKSAGKGLPKNVMTPKKKENTGEKKIENALFRAGSKAKTPSVTTTWDLSSMSDLSSYAIDLDQFEYEGFNIDHFMALLASIAQDGGKTQDEFAGDMRMIVGIVVKRGTDMQKIYDKTSKEASEVAKDLFTFYKVTKNDTKKPVARDVIILSRFTAAFPILAAQLLAEGRVTPFCTDGEIPCFLRFSGAASLIPSSNQALFDEYIKFQNGFDKIINGKKADADNVKKFADISWRSTKFNDAQRGRFISLFEKMVSGRK